MRVRGRLNFCAAPIGIGDAFAAHKNFAIGVELNVAAGQNFSDGSFSGDGRDDSQ